MANHSTSGGNTFVVELCDHHVNQDVEITRLTKDRDGWKRATELLRDESEAFEIDRQSQIERLTKELAFRASANEGHMLQAIEDDARIISLATALKVATEALTRITSVAPPFGGSTGRLMNRIASDALAAIQKEQ